MSARVLLLEDDRRLAQMLIDYLGANGVELSHAFSANDALARLAGGGFDALILDLMLPDADGLDVCRRIRGEPTLRHLPVLMLTARGDTTDRVIGLELGADDYLSKPFDPRELLARVRAVMRRGSQSAASETQPILRFGRLEIDRDAFQVRQDGEPVPLTAHQFALLRILAEHAGRVLSRDFLLESLRGQSAESLDRSIDVHVSKLRQLLEDNPKQPTRILTLRGVGYLFARSQE
ncbi:response regulator transcription factor [Pseudomarimonas arenosa]|uniref:Response regulator transcription factor n=1 Tax=Pseudomarimonas arenosa TaxID=2774145 RepID=A0AAW3ZP56_9GAMM|nr:response regulator transcription factor [Pseudomarimonas arenosa]MBD8526877.1 response regulator transcription factor [Pseudomarimonas arenosa]